MKNIIFFLIFSLFLLSACTSNSSPNSISDRAPGSLSETESFETKSSTEEEIEVSPDQAIEYLNKLDPTVFGFSDAVQKFTLSYIGSADINSNECYQVNAVATYSDGTVSENIIFIRTNLSAIYMYDNKTHEYNEVTETNYTGSDVSSSDSSVSISEDTAIALLMEYSKEELGLPAEISEYTLMNDGETTVDGVICIEIGVYADLGERMQRMGGYCVSSDLHTVYAFDIITGEFEALPSPEDSN